MSKVDVLYSWFTSELERICNSAEAEAFVETLEGNRMDTFVTLVESLRSLKAELDSSRIEQIHFLGWLDVLSKIQEFSSLFHDFPNFDGDKFALFSLLANRIAESEDRVIENVGIDTTPFEIRTLSTAFPLAWFTHQSTPSLDNSIAVFRISPIDSFLNDFNLTVVSPELAYAILNVIPDSSLSGTAHSVVVRSQTPQIEDAAVQAYVSLQILASGKSIHTPQSYSGILNILNRDEMAIGHPYQQWNDVLHVLSEYNSQSEILHKYLIIYHVIENFMFKLPVVSLEGQNNGRLFSMRDFQRLYERIDVSERTALNNLFAVLLKESAVPGGSLKEHIKSRWSSLVPSIAQNDIRDILGLLGLQKDKRPMEHGEFGDDLPKNLAGLVYGIRNAIVHNKPTEFHLTYASMNITVLGLIQSFLIPTLEELCFATLSKPNAHLWFTNRQLNLYE